MTTPTSPATASRICRAGGNLNVLHSVEAAHMALAEAAIGQEFLRTAGIDPDGVL